VPRLGSLTRISVCLLKSHDAATREELGEGGAALRVRESVPTMGALALEFVLPNKTNVITTSAEVVWPDVKGGLGVRFLRTSYMQQTAK